MFHFCVTRDSSELFVTSSKNDVRVWHLKSGKELLRLSVANLTCHAVAVTPDGKAIITGIKHTLLRNKLLLLVVLAWDDGEIRAFYPESGKSMYTIHSAHNKVAT